MSITFNQQGDYPSGWESYPLHAGNKHLAGRSRAFYHDRLLKDSSRLFEPVENSFELTGLVLNSHGRSDFVRVVLFVDGIALRRYRAPIGKSRVLAYSKR
jgi:hypothetical protein